MPFLPPCSSQLVSPSAGNVLPAQNWQAICSQWARVASAVVILIGCLSCLAWSFNLSLLQSVFPAAGMMKANTALCFVLAGGSLWGQTRNRHTALNTGITKGCAIAVSTIGLLTLSQYLFGWNLGIDQLLFQDASSPAKAYPGRMGDNTALNFTLTGLALWLRGTRSRRSDTIAQIATLSIAAIALLALVGYAYNIQVSYRFIFYSTSMSIPTTLTFLVLSAGILASRADYPLVQLLTQNWSGSSAVRRLMPITIALPFGVGWLILQGLRANLYDASFGLALFVVALMLAFICILYITAARLNQVDYARKRSLDRLQASEDRLELALQGAGQGIWDWDLKTQTLTWDDRCKAIFGLPPDFPITHAWHLDALHPDDRQRVFEAAELALRHRTKFDQEYRTFYPDGTMRWILAQGRGYYDAAGEPCQMVGTVLDITDRKQSEAALQERSNHIQLLYETTRDLLSADQPLALVEALFAKLKPLMGLDVYVNYWLHEDQQRLQLKFYGGISDQLAREIEWLAVGCAVCGTVAQERRQIVQSDLQHSTDPTSEVVRSLGLTAYACQPLLVQGKLFGTLSFGSRSRITFTPAEMKLFQAICDQIAIALERSALVSSLQQQTQDLTEANRLKDEFLAALSHELRTPLNPILGWTAMLKAQRLTPAKTAEALNTIDRNVRQQIRLVDDLLDVSSVIQGRLKLALGPVDLAQTIQDAIATVQLSAQAKGLAIALRGLPSLMLVADRDRLQQVFWNLLSNAIKFTPAPGRVEVELSVIETANLETANCSAQVRVTDTGIGLDPKDLPYVFDRFRQVDGSSTRNYGGLGLGLAIVRQLVELHGGNVTVESLGVGQGSTFTVTLPIRTAGLAATDSATPTPHLNLAEPAQPAQIASAQSFATTSLAGVRILTVEDDPDNLDLVRFLLEQDGATVTPETSPLKAIERISSQPFELIVSDIGLPELDGYELIQQIRALPQGRHIPALALTAFVYQDDQQKAIEAGFQAHITKPVNPIELLEVLTQLLKNGHYRVGQNA